MVETERKSGILLLRYNLVGQPFSDSFIKTTPPREKTWFTCPYLCKSLHLPQIYLQYKQRDADIKALLRTFKCPKFLLLIRFCLSVGFLCASGWRALHLIFYLALCCFLRDGVVGYNPQYPDLCTFQIIVRNDVWYIWCFNVFSVAILFPFRLHWKF